MHYRTMRLPVVMAVTVLLAGCKTFTPDGGISAVADFAGLGSGKEIVRLRTEEDARHSRDAVAKLLARPLTAESAVQIALLNNRGLQAAYNELGISEAARVGAYLPPNPTFSIERMANSLEVEVGGRVLANILALLTLPARADIAEDRYRQAQLRAAEETLRVAVEARRSFYRAVAASEHSAFLDDAKAAAETATKLARRLGETGAMNKLDQAREQVFYAEVAAQLAAQQQRRETERERLIRILGLWGKDTAFSLPKALPPLPQNFRALPAVEIEAVRRRVDLQAARLEVEALAKSLGLSNATRFINLLEVAGIAERKKERATGEIERMRGGEIEFQIPLFDFGQVGVRQAEEKYLQAIHRLTEKAVNVRSEARDAYRIARSAYDLARHYRTEVLPLRKIISDETLLRYNAMQIDVFALLAEARKRVAATTSAIDAHRDFWIASTDLMSAVVGGGGGMAIGSTPMAAAEAGGGGH
jgi:outer membrane protein TolC